MEQRPLNVTLISLGFLALNMLICFPTITGFSGLFRGECNKFILFVFVPFWVAGIYIPISIASAWDGYLKVMVYLAVAIPYFVGILAECMDCCFGVKPCCPYKPELEEFFCKEIARERNGQMNDNGFEIASQAEEETMEEGTRKNIIVTAPDETKIDVSDRFCSICFDKYHDEEDISISMDPTTECKHIFHKSCITEWMEQSHNNCCPICGLVYVMPA